MIIKVYKLIDSLQDFNNCVGFWGGAKSVWENLNDDQRTEAEILFTETFIDNENYSEVEINDWVWFDLPDMLEQE